MSYPNGYAFRADCDFQYTYANWGAFVDIIVDSKLETGIHKYFTNGSLTYKNLEIKFTGKKFEINNFINIIIKITNIGSSIINYSINNKFDTQIEGVDVKHNASGLPGFKGYREIGKNKIVDFYFNNSYKVTSATSSLRTGWGNFGKEDPVDDNFYFLSSGLGINWENRIIRAGEVQKIRYSIGYGKYFDAVPEQSLNYNDEYLPFLYSSILAAVFPTE